MSVVVLTRDDPPRGVSCGTKVAPDPRRQKIPSPGSRWSEQVVTGLPDCEVCGLPVRQGPRGGVRTAHAACIAEVRGQPRRPQTAAQRSERQRAHRISRGQPRVRLCVRCQEPATSSRHTYCDQCRADVAAAHPRSRRPQKSSTARGYGGPHQALRRRWAPKVATGGVVCGLCGYAIEPGSHWHLGHPDDRKDLEPVPWHASCNTRFAAAVTRPRRRKGLQ